MYPNVAFDPQTGQVGVKEFVGLARIGTVYD